MAATIPIHSLIRTLRNRGEDAPLLAAVANGDERAFAELVRRYGPMVLGVARRVLRSNADADDAFQLAFVSLFQSARSIRNPAALPGWLHRTALRCALKIRSRTAPSAAAPRPAGSTDPLAEVTWNEVRGILDEELNSLPANLRQVLVLCYLEGRSQDDAAAILDVSRSTLKRRLADGLARLQRRLSTRGVAALGLISAALGEDGFCAVIPNALVERTVELASQSFAPGLLTGITTALNLRRAILGLAFALVIAGGVLVAQPGPEPTQPKAETPAKTDSPKPGFDQLEDPLPEGALARLGTSRLRGARLTYSPDSKKVVRESAGGDLQLYEVPSGKYLAKLRAADVPERDSIVGSTIGFSPDSKMLAAVCWKGRTGIWDTTTGKLIRWLESGRFYSIVECEFSPDGKLLAVGGNHDPKDSGVEKISTGVYEVSTGKQLFVELGSTARFSQDGQRLFLWNGYGASPKERFLRTVSVPNPEERSALLHQSDVSGWDYPMTDGRGLLFELLTTGTVQLRDLKSGDVKHSLEGAVGTEKGRVQMRHAPGRRELLVVQFEPPMLWSWNIDTGKEIWKREMPAPPYFAALSQDGKTLSVPGKDGNVLIINALTGKDRIAISARSVGHSNSSTKLSPDGQVVATFTASPEPGGGSVLFWDASSGKKLTDLPGHSALIVDAFFTRDSKIVTAGRDKTLRTWDATHGRELAQVPLDAVERFVPAPDGRTLYATDSKTGNIRVVNPGTGKVEATFPAFKKSIVGFTLTSDGKRLIVAGRDADESGIIRFLNASTGESIREFDTNDYRIEQLATSADGTVIATSGSGRKVAVWTVEGKLLAEFEGIGTRRPAWEQKTPHYLIGSVAVSADGSRLAFSDQEAGVAVIDTKTLKILGRAKQKDVYFQSTAARYDVRDLLAFAPDGQTVAWSGIESTTDIQLIELRTQTVRRQLNGDSYPVKRIAFSPDGSRLLSAGPDGSALVWDLFGRQNRKPVEPADAKIVAGWWNSLASEEAATADAAMRALATHPADALKLLREKLRGSMVEPAVLDRLIADLGDANFATREAATKQLMTLGAAAAKLTAVAETSGSSEVRERAEKILKRLNRTAGLADSRAIEVLEWLGDAESQKFLAELAGAKPETALQKNAAAALKRLKPQ